MTTQPLPRRRQFNLYWALGLSILIHALLVVISLWLPLIPASSASIEPTEDRITFSFAEEPSSVDDAPLPGPIAPLNPVPQQIEPLPPAPSALEAPPIPPGETTPYEDAQPQEQPEEPPGEPEPLEDARVAEETSRTDTPPDRTSDRATSQTREFDLQRALKDFSRSVRSRPPSRNSSASPPTPPQNVITPDFSAVPSSGFGMGSLTFESRDYDWSDYGRQIYMAIWRAWHNRLHASTDEFERWAHENQNWYLHHDAAVRFVIDQHGEVSGIVVEGISGCVPLDDSAFDALSEVILPPLPADFPRDREVVHARFIMTGEIRALRPVLRRYKAMGLF